MPIDKTIKEINTINNNPPHIVKSFFVFHAYIDKLKVTPIVARAA